MTFKNDSTSKPRSGHASARLARIRSLSAYKRSKATWWTMFEPRLVMGNQETIRPLNPATQTHIASPRLKELAQPKKTHQPPNTFLPEYQYSCGRESRIWEVAPSALVVTSTERIRFLSRHKSAPIQYTQQKPQFVLSCGRSSPLWKPSPAAMRCPDRPRTAALARSKPFHLDYNPPKPVHTVVSELAKKCTPSDYICHLAQPKARPDGPFRDPEWEVSAAALKAEAPQRVTDLARCKRFAEGYEPGRSILWKVSPGAKHAVASTRLCELAKPIIRQTMDSVQFNPEAFFVSETAKKAKASSRIEELAQPIERGK